MKKSNVIILIVIVLAIILCGTLAFTFFHNKSSKSDNIDNGLTNTDFLNDIESNTISNEIDNNTNDIITNEIKEDSSVDQQNKVSKDTNKQEKPNTTEKKNNNKNSSSSTNSSNTQNNSSKNDTDKETTDKNSNTNKENDNNSKYKCEECGKPVEYEYHKTWEGYTCSSCGMSSKNYYETEDEEEKPHTHIFTVNTGKWFDTQAELEAYVDKVLKDFDNKLENGEITWEEYGKQCPMGYDVYRCTCGKRGLNFAYSS